MIKPGIAISPPTIEAFLGLFSSTPASLAAALRDCLKPWQMLPVQDRPLLRLGDDVVVLDERYLVERVTRGLYWLVHDYEKATYGDKARNRWTQAYSQMVETRVEDQLRRMAPQLIGGQYAFFTEEDLQAAFPGDRNIDAGADFGGEVVLAEVVAGTVKLATREQADVISFREDAERLVLGKARQLYVSPPTCCATRSPRTPRYRSPPAASSRWWSAAISSRSTRSPSAISASNSPPNGCRRAGRSSRSLSSTWRSWKAARPSTSAAA